MRASIFSRLLGERYLGVRYGSCGYSCCIMGETTDGIAAYLRDVLELEERVRPSIAAQTKTHPVIGSAREMCDRHIAELKSVLQSIGGEDGTIDPAMNALRDQYTALSSCTITYGMLLAAANASGNQELAALAQRHLHDYAETVVQIADAIPGLLSRDARVSSQTRHAIHDAWHTSAQTTTGSVESDAALNRTVSKSTYPTV